MCLEDQMALASTFGRVVQVFGVEPGLPFASERDPGVLDRMWSLSHGLCLAVQCEEAGPRLRIDIHNSRVVGATLVSEDPGLEYPAGSCGLTLHLRFEHGRDATLTAWNANAARLLDIVPALLGAG